MTKTRWVRALPWILTGLALASAAPIPAAADDIVLVPTRPIDRKFPSSEWCQVQNVYYFGAPSCSVFVDFGVKLTGPTGGSFGLVALDDILVTRYGNLISSPTCTICPNVTDAAGNILYHNWCYTTNTTPAFSEDFGSNWQEDGWLLGPGASVGFVNGSQALMFRPGAGVPDAPCDTARARLVLTNLAPGYQYALTLWWSVENPQPGEDILSIGFSRPAVCTGESNCGANNCFVWPNLPNACALPTPAGFQVGLQWSGTQWYAKSSWRKSTSPFVTGYRVYRSATQHLGSTVASAGHFLGATTDTSWDDLAFNLGETNYYVVATNAQGALGPPAEAALAIPPGELIPDANTTLLLHFNGNTTGSAGETPSVATGVSFEGGVFGQGAYLSSLNQLTYPSAGNISPTVGTLDFWIKPRWSSSDGMDHYVLHLGDAGGILIGKDAANFWRSILNRFGEAGPEIGTGHFITSEWTPNTWHHSAFTWSPASVALYIDGQLVSSAVPGIAPPAVADPILQIGGDGANAMLNAVLDEFRLSDVVRTPQEILDCFYRREVVGVEDSPRGASGLAFRSIAPNPGAGSMRITYATPESGPVEIGVFDVSGRRVDVLFAGDLPAGEHVLEWDGLTQRGVRVRPGIYFFRLQSRGQSASHRAVVM